jgi:hypothetical protein
MPSHARENVIIKRKFDSPDNRDDQVLHEEIEQRISASDREEERSDGEELCGEEWNHRFFPAQFG